MSRAARRPRLNVAIIKIANGRREPLRNVEPARVRANQLLPLRGAAQQPCSEAPPHSVTGFDPCAQVRSRRPRDRGADIRSRAGSGLPPDGEAVPCARWLGTRVTD